MRKFFQTWEDRISDAEVDLAILRSTRRSQLRRHQKAMQEEAERAHSARNRGNQTLYQGAFDQLRQMMGREQGLQHQLKTLAVAESTLSSIRFQADSAGLLNRISLLTQGALKRSSFRKTISALQRGNAVSQRFAQHQELLGQLSDDLMEDAAGAITNQQVEERIAALDVKADPVAQMIQQRMQALNEGWEEENNA